MANQFGITGIYETHLSVRDLERSIAFYRDIVGLPLAERFTERGIAFFWVDQARSGMLGLWKGGSGPLSMKLHFAFKAEKEAILEAPQHLKAAGVTPLDFDGAPTDEPVVIGWMPALSLYFKDPDGHSIELLHKLDETPGAGFGTGPWSAWRER